MPSQTSGLRSNPLSKPRGQWNVLPGWLLVAGAMVAGAPKTVASPEIPGAAQTRPIALVGATVHPVDAPPVASGIVLFEAGKITGVGKDVRIPSGATKIDVKGKQVYPAMFDAFTSIGLVEINAVRATKDQSETGRINPNVKARVAVNPDSEMIPVTRSNGVLLALSAPSGGLISGQASVMMLDGWTWEDMTLSADAAMIVQWPRMAPVSDWAVASSAKEQMASRDRNLKELEKAFEDARAYRASRQSKGTGQAFDSRWNAMIPVLERKTPIIVVAEGVQQIQAAVAFAVRENIRMILCGGYDAPLCAPLLKKHHIPVIVRGTYRLPRRRHDDYDTPFTVPERLRSQGVRYCISGTDRFGATAIRNLPYHAAMGIAFGLPQDEALKAITLYPAEILGVADRVGTIEIGKDATLIVTDGDPLETATHLEAAYIQGRQVDLDNRQKRLWRKYQQKYHRLEHPVP